MKIRIECISFELKAPFVITGHVFENIETVRVTLEQDGAIGRGEGVGVYYLGETVESMTAQLEAIVAEVERNASHEAVEDLLPPGGARNALDCAFWDLRAKKSGKSIWSLLDIAPHPLTTVFTIGIYEPEVMAQRAANAKNLPKLKIKLDDDRPVEKIKAIKNVRPDAELIVDANQGWTIEILKEVAPVFEALGVKMIEQPLPRGDDWALKGYRSPVPLGADESCLHTGEFEAVKSLYDVINIKLDKTGGLTEGLKLANAVTKAGLDLMVGNMMGASLSMAPSFVVGQFCRFVDIDGPLLLTEDIEHGLTYGPNGEVAPADGELWG